ncbi:MAG: hypothetical protein AAGA54_14580 [Myxococcota bacterium]
MRDATVLRRKLCALACLPLLAAGCEQSPAPTPAKAPSASASKRANPKPKPETKAASTRTGPRINEAPPPPPLPTDPDELRMMPIEGDPPFIDGYNPEEEPCPSGNWCGAIEAAQAIAPKAGEPKMEMGCPTRIIGAHDPSPVQDDRKTYAGLSPKNAMQGALNGHGTQLRRDAGEENTCCYHWFEYCSGRPLVDAGAARTADAIGRTDWADLACPVASPIAAELLDAWLSDAAAEHASVAAFARVAMELMAVGAPPQLLDDTLQAAKDEVGHAQACYGMASRFTPRVLGPGALPAAAPRTADLVQVAVDAFLEGCVGETTAALVAERAAARATDQHAHDVLAVIAEDESQHAALAWRTVSWALERGGAAVAGALREAFEALPAPRFEPTPSHPHWGHYGRLSDREMLQATNDARRDIVGPMLHKLLGATTQPAPARA